MIEYVNGKERNEPELVELLLLDVVEFGASLTRLLVELDALFEEGLAVLDAHHLVGAYLLLQILAVALLAAARLLLLVALLLGKLQLSSEFTYSGIPKFNILNRL